MIESGLLCENGCATLVEGVNVGEAFKTLIGKVYDFDYIHVLADVENQPIRRIPISFVLSSVYL